MATIDGTNGTDTLDGVAGESNVLSGLGGADLLTGRDRTDFLFGGSGDDTLSGGGAGDFMQGDAGDDTFLLGPGDDVIHGFAPAGSETVGSDDRSRDLIDASGLSFADGARDGLSVAFSGAGAGTIRHAGDRPEGESSYSVDFSGIGILIATDLDDSILGGEGAETILAGAGDDTVLAGAGGGDISGEAGDDSIVAGATDGVYSGGLGADTLSGAEVGAAMELTLDAGGRGSFTASGQTSSFSGFEAFVGSDEGDRFIGSTSGDRFEGGAGDDVISGGGGTDVAVFDARAVEAQFFVTETGDYRVVTPDLGDDLLRGIELFEFADTTLTLENVALIAEPAPEDDGGADRPDDGEEDDREEDGEDGGTAVSGNPSIGTGIETRSDRGIAAAIFGEDGIDPTSIDYAGAGDAIALLPGGFEISDGETAVFIESGIFLTNGGGPGTENTENGFSVDLGEPGDARLTATAAAAFPEAGSTNDAAVVTLTVDGSEVPTGTLALDLFFGSDEYPEYADSAFVDIAAVYVNGVNYALFANDPLQPLAIVGDAINTPGNFFDNQEGAFNTEYDGFSTLLTVLLPIAPGLNEIVIGIADTGDSVLDSGLFVGDAEATDIDATGSFVNVIGTGTADALQLNAAPQIVAMNGGADTVTGSAAGFDRDIIEGWSDNDLLVVTGDLDPDEMLTEVTASGLEIGFDANGNGIPEDVFTLLGDFELAEVIVTETGAGLEIRTTGVRPAPPVIETGTARSERFFGATGNDEIDGAGGNDTIAGDEGADTLRGGAGDDSILGSSGMDRIEGGEGNDALRGNDDADVVLGGAGDDTLSGGVGADSLYGQDGDDVIAGGAGADTIGGGAGGDRIDSGAGDDFIGGGSEGDRIFAGAGRDTIGGGDGDDFVVGGAGADVIAGGAGDDELDGEYGNDVVAGSYGEDLVFGGRGDDNLGGGAGRDTLIGGLGDDTMGAGRGDDSLAGGAGDDFVAGGGRNDVLVGEDGNDTLNGGAGDDTLTGGAGADLFVWNGMGSGDTDIVTDYAAGEDTLLLIGVSPVSLSFSQIVLGGTLYAVAEVGDQRILFEGLSVEEIGQTDFLFI
ncbi:choice-of-anchor L domain-containing protein [Roseivivax sediminis]|uniref:Hemolysin-type calcium-binding repeat-containing protein n=1 Tax=Roseivivax sediminis TaxID=936889 RepID=A0A1I2AE68_9RHOB|nr:choice-of-anchor L domain-containing protein [Roseivivax sediminis]SFE41848.1 Hemolysin-type calcium-binding repeat-containing protein [Roseivivax sediminis]